MGSLVTGAGKFAHGGPEPDRYVTLGAASFADQRVFARGHNASRGAARLTRRRERAQTT